MNSIGIMQGRLSPPHDSHIQTFPEQTWRDEFFLARKAGFDCIEWIYEFETEQVNPLSSDEGINEIKKIVNETRIAVDSVCADYFMSKKLIGESGNLQTKVLAHLKWLIRQANLLNAKYMVLPFVDTSSLKPPSDLKALLEILENVLPILEKAKIELHLETDLEPQEFVGLLKQINHPLIKANYDIGNSASLGHDPVEEFFWLDKWIGSVHVKDRILNGGTVPLGRGDADFSLCFRILRRIAYKGPFILQAARDESIDEYELAVKNKLFVEDYLSEVYTAN